MEQDKCLDICNTNWRHKFIKRLSILIIIINLIYLVDSFFNKIDKKKSFFTIIDALAFIYFYTLYNYIDDIAKNKECICTNINHNTITMILYYGIKILFYGPSIIYIITFLCSNN